MEKSNLSKSQILKTVLLLLLLLYIPFVPSSLRQSYLYFLLNILIIALAIESGFLKSTPNNPHIDKIKSAAVLASPVVLVSNSCITPLNGSSSIGTVHHAINQQQDQALKALLQVEKVRSTTAATMRRKKMKRCPSRPSIFFICADQEKQKVVAEELGHRKWEEDSGEELTKQELYAKAEEFIGNFYNQLKMQREDSWKKIHGIYHRAF